MLQRILSIDVMRANNNARRVPEEFCAHANETVIAGADDAFTHTQIQCDDCGSVRINACKSRNDDLSHSETF